MFYSKSTCTLHVVKCVKCLSNKSLATTKTASKVQKKVTNEVAPAKKKAKKSKKKNILVKEEVDDSEEYWLDHLNAQNLKLFRRTSLGSFRKINNEKLLDKLKLLLPELLNVEVHETPVQNETSPPKAVSSERTAQDNKKLADPHLSDFLLQNMLSFPLFNTSNGDPLQEFLKLDNEPYGEVDSVKLPSVTRILSETMSDPCKERLKLWEEKMIEKMGVEGFMEHRKNTLNSGSKLHGCLKKYLETKDESQVAIDPQIEGCWNSVKHLLSDITDVKMVEEPVHHPVLLYKGIVDCVASFRDVPCVIEWKKSDKKKSVLPATHDAPVQLCAYMGALAWQKKVPNLENGLIVVVYSDGTPATVLPMDMETCEVYWIEWLQRLQHYWGCRAPALMKSKSEI